MFLGIIFFVAAALAEECNSALEQPIRNPREATHWEITHDLYRGGAVSGRSFRKNENMNRLLQVELFNPRTLRSRQALFKPRFPGDGFGWNRVPMEYVAYRLNYILGMDIVPPAAYRRGFFVPGEGHFAEGAIMHFVPEAQAPPAKADADFQLKLGVLSYLLLTEDRHSGNLVFGRHWVTESPAWAAVDFASSLRTDESKFPLPSLKKIGPDLRHRLQKLSFNQLRAEFHEFLSNNEVSGILSRRDRLLSNREN